MLGHTKLLEKVASENKKTFISTGMSTLDEIEKAVKIFKSAKCDFELMHCNSTYPMPEEDANLMCIPSLKRRYNCKVGYSGHEPTLLKICVTAVALGATSIERHITLDRYLWGSDQLSSIEPSGVFKLVKGIRGIEKAIHYAPAPRRQFEKESIKRKSLRK